MAVVRFPDEGRAVTDEAAVRETLARAGCKNKALVIQLNNALRCFSQQRSRTWLLKHARAIDESNIDTANLLKPRLRFR